MWMLLIVILSGPGSITSQLVPFADLQGCEKAKLEIQRVYTGSKFLPRAICHCVDVDQ